MLIQNGMNKTKNKKLIENVIKWKKKVNKIKGLQEQRLNVKQRKKEYKDGIKE
jgi:hypothetical protein